MGTMHDMSAMMGMYAGGTWYGWYGHRYIGAYGVRPTYYKGLQNVPAHRFSGNFLVTMVCCAICFT